ncbi:Hypothetical protein CINCED_3A021903 [Cinara cedri]|uniref:Uncharacterized protein n=1 Tax=Cinara cedri TaxID=506608 RepID=A0A5E4NC55_9HEMI|nr:Hypothetical protein CINCED_3A021903 [Cinara cedri]
MAAKLNTANVENLNDSMKSIVNELEASCYKLKSMEGNEDLYNQLNSIIKSLSIEVKNNEFAMQISNIEESIKNKQHFYRNKFGIELNALPENAQLEFTSNLLHETGIDDNDYRSNNLFTKYMSMIEKTRKQKEIIDDIDEHINNLKIVIEQQNDLKCELSNITYTPVGYTAEPININYIESVQPVTNCDKVVELVKKIHDIEKNQADICGKILELKAEQKKVYHGLPPNIDQTIMAVQIAEQTMKSMSKKLAEKLTDK